MVQLTEFDTRIIEYFSYNTEASQLFLVLAFLMQRNMSGGLSTYDLMALKNVKESLKKHISHSDDKDVLNNLIELISTTQYTDLASIIDSSSAQYIAKQGYRSLCKILATYLANDLGVLVKIPINDQLNLEQLIEDAKKEHPRTAMNIDVTPVNPWQVIFDPPALSECPNCILIAFPTPDNEERSVYYLKGLCMAASLLKEPEVDEDVLPDNRKSDETVTLTPLNLFKGILSVSSRLISGKKKSPNSDPVLVSNSEERASKKKDVEDELPDNKPNTSNSASSPKEVGESALQSDNHLTAGFFDVNHGYYFSVRKRKDS